MTSAWGRLAAGARLSRAEAFAYRLMGMRRWLLPPARQPEEPHPKGGWARQSRGNGLQGPRKAIGLARGASPRASGATPSGGAGWPAWSMISFLYHAKGAEGPEGAPDATPATIHARRRVPKPLAALPEGYKNEIIDQEPRPEAPGTEPPGVRCASPRRSVLSRMSSGPPGKRWESQGGRPCRPGTEAPPHLHGAPAGWQAQRLAITPSLERARARACGC